MPNKTKQNVLSAMARWKDYRGCTPFGWFDSGLINLAAFMLEDQ